MAEGDVVLITGKDDIHFFPLFVRCERFSPVEAEKVEKQVMKYCKILFC
jgi:hypothetical protein